MTASDDLALLADDYWRHLLDADPLEAHGLGYYPRVEGRFADATRSAEDADVAASRALADRAEAIDPAGLGEQERISRLVIADGARDRATFLEARLREVGADPIFGEQTLLPLMLGMLTLPDAEVAGVMPGVLEGAGRFFADLAGRHREGLARGWAPAAFAVTGTLEQLDAALATPIADDPLVAALHPPAEGLDVEEWRGRLRGAVEQHVRPGLATYRDVLRDEVLPLARPDERCGLGSLPGGDDAYDRALRYYTTTDMTAQEIHEMGLAQVAALAEEYRALGQDALGTDDLAEIFERMREDPALHFEHGDQLVTASREAMARAAAVMGEWFSTVPQAPCAVAATQSGAKAFYFPPASDGSRGGTFFVNVDDPTAWGTFELEAMAFHEGIPGHHLQLAIAGELPGDLPDFRKHFFHHAYAEGWGLYSERLADEMGLYGTDLDRLGMLSADSMRACRLVVDTGLHAMGWSRQRAVDYMLDNSPLAAGVVRPEVDRYVVSPGQATSYMVGRLEIQRMRREAEQRQGDRFDVRAFHAAVLDSGSLPLGVLDRVVSARLT